MEGSRETLLNAKKLAEEWPEFGGENWAFIGYNGVE